MAVLTYLTLLFTCISIGVWTLAVLLALPPLTEKWGVYDFLPNQSFCFCDWTTSISYTFFMVGVCFGGPCSVMTFCYFKILRVVRQSRKRVASKPLSTITDPPKNTNSSSPKKAVPSIKLNGDVSRRNSPTASPDARPRVVQVDEDDTRAKLRLKMDAILRAQTIAMAQNNLANSGQFDAEDCGPSRQNDTDRESPPCPPVKLKPLKPQQREIKWIVPGERSVSQDSLPGSISDDEDSNSNRVNGATRSAKPTEKSSLTRLAVPLAGKSARKKVRRKNRSESERRRKEEELKLTKSFLVVILVFVICWLPFCITMFWNVFAFKFDKENRVPRPLDMSTLLLGYANSCCNPIIYGVMNKRFRVGYQAVICSWRKRSNSIAQTNSGINLNTSMGSGADQSGYTISAVSTIHSER